MKKILSGAGGMNIIGQGGKIILLSIPSLALALLCQKLIPEIALWPEFFTKIKFAGYLLLLPGIILWISGVVQLVLLFPKGKLITTGAYSVCRNPIYSSFIFFILPGVAILTQNWMYLLVSVSLLAGVLLFIKKEESQLESVFGQEYLSYKLRVHRVIPFIKPG